MTYRVVGKEACTEGCCTVARDPEFEHQYRDWNDDSNIARPMFQILYADLYQYRAANPFKLSWTKVGDDLFDGAYTYYGSDEDEPSHWFKYHYDKDEEEMITTNEPLIHL